VTRHVNWFLRLVVALVVPAGSASAHHSATMFEQTKTVTVEGVVKEFQFSNPHSWLLVDVTDKNGKVTTWGFEAEGPSTLQRAGIRPSEFRAGTKVTMTGRPMKDGRPAAIWVLAVRGDGKKFDPREGFQVK
jgi:cytochrome c-type biogenesis protein CcmE